MIVNPITLLQDLIRCPSVTPIEGGALELLEKLLTAHGFKCTRLKFSDEGVPDVDNLYARWGTDAPNIAFAGHTDVVPVGDESAWSFDPFGGEIIDGFVCGRGAADMKGGVAAFAAAAIEFVKKTPPKGSISLIITGDEEGLSINGTRKMLKWMEENNEKVDFCLVGEPTSVTALGDMAKIGRRGILSAYLSVTGKQGHSAYPHLADNPLPRLVTILKAVNDMHLDDGTEYFQPSNLEITNIHVGNTADNVIPAKGTATINVRFNNTYTGAALEKKMRDTMTATGLDHDVRFRISGECFYNPPGKFSDMISKAIEKETGRTPELSTTGGTSDARFIKDYCPVVEFGPLNKTIHQVNEQVSAADVEALTRIYGDIIARFFSAAD